MNLDALVAPLRADVVSGAAVVSRTAAEVVRRVAVRGEVDDVASLRHLLGDLAVRILDAQPAMAPLVTLLSDALAALDGAGDVDGARRRVAREAEAFRTRLEEEGRRAGAHAAKALDAGARVMTLSDSSTVRAALLGAGERGPLEVICLEGRPMQEGRALARTLAGAGLRVTCAVDAAAEALVADCDAVLLGADSVGDRGIVNKIGSAGLIRAAGSREVPVWVVTDDSKLLPPGFPQPLDDDRPAEEVWRGASGVRVWNRYFEVVPLSWVSRIITGAGSASPEEIEAERAGLDVPPELARWAARRSEHH
jgi:translation initiation factor 2B subunit (eIF-2B alpha/beta/delta family)